MVKWIKKINELKRLSQADYYTYIRSLTPEEREILWERDDAPFIKSEFNSSLKEELKKIETWEIKTYGPFNTTQELKKSLNF